MKLNYDGGGANFFHEMGDLAVDTDHWPRWMRRVARYTFPVSAILHLVAIVGFMMAGMLGGLLIGFFWTFPQWWLEFYEN